jgi:hypothetical protein
MITRPNWSMHGLAIAVVKCLKLVVVAALVLALRAPAVGQDREGSAGPFDPTGAALCGWMIYVLVQGATAGCGLARRPVDDAIDESIVAIEEFILANSTQHLTRAMLEEGKRNLLKSSWGMTAQSGQRACEANILKFAETTPSLPPDQIRAGIRALLVAPREPVARPTPCL